MGNKAVIDKRKILDAACALVAEQGASALNMRNVATRCGVSVGSIYNYYPQKSDLLADAVERFWRDAIADESLSAMRPAEGENFVDFCERVMERLVQPLERFRSVWLSHMAKFNADEIATGKRREDAYFAHIRKGLESALASDPDIDRSFFSGGVTEEELCAHVWEVMLTSLRRGRTDAAPLFALLRAALYR